MIETRCRSYFFALKRLTKTLKDTGRAFAEIDTQMAGSKSSLQTLFPGAALHLSYRPVDREVLARPPGPLGPQARAG